MSYVFVTVGTTLFDELIKTVDSPSFHALLQQKGYNGLLIQIGYSDYKPKCSTEANELPTSVGDDFVACHYNVKPSIAENIKNAALVISHAGAGSIIETLQQQKPSVVVINTSLMHNHQEELANALSTPQNQYVLVATPSNLQSQIQKQLDRYLKERKLLGEIDTTSFGNRLVEKFGVVENKKQKKQKTMVVIGSGGHTAEMFHALSGVDTEIFTPRCYVLATTDRRSEDKILEFEQKVSKSKRKKSNRSEESYHVKKIPRSRHVGQSKITSIWTTIWSFFFCLKLLYQERPDLLLVNGPGTCVPVVMAALLFRMFRVFRTRVVYVESIARVKDLSLSGKILQRFTDWFIIQWPDLYDKTTTSDLWMKNFFFPVED